jgi:hypothetical protein
MQSTERKFRDFFWEIPEAQFPTDFDWDRLPAKLCVHIVGADPKGTCTAYIDRGPRTLLLARSTIEHDKTEWFGSANGVVSAMQWAKKSEDVTKVEWNDCGECNAAMSSRLDVLSQGAGGT